MKQYPQKTLSERKILFQETMQVTAIYPFQKKGVYQK